jgi:type IV pilus assembly protein PilE
MLKKSQHGVTLIELLIVIAIMGILGAVAYPSYVTFVTKSKRAEPQRELLALANLMEQYFSDHRTYTDELTDLGKSADSYVTESGNYTISASINGTGTTYTLTAAIKTGSSQASDSECASMTVNSIGQKGATNTTCWEK